MTWRNENKINEKRPLTDTISGILKSFPLSLHGGSFLVEGSYGLASYYTPARKMVTGVKEKKPLFHFLYVSWTTFKRIGTIAINAIILGPKKFGKIKCTL